MGVYRLGRLGAGARRGLFRVGRAGVHGASGDVGRGRSAARGGCAEHRHSGIRTSTSLVHP